MFHVPHPARLLSGPLASDDSYGNNGCFEFESIEPGWYLIAIAADGAGWDHVSVRALSRNHKVSRIPSWKEMVQAKALFWDDDDRVVQYHPPRREYVNCHPHVLHLWRPTTVELPFPPSILVGPNLTSS